MLAPGSYSLRATAYPDISCSGGSCSCERQQIFEQLARARIEPRFRATLGV